MVGVAAVLAAGMLGAVSGGAAASGSRHHVARGQGLVLAASEAPGLRPAGSGAAAARKALAAALAPPASTPAARPAQAAHFLRRRGIDLWSLAYVFQRPGQADGVLRATVAAGRRAHLKRVRIELGERGWLLAPSGRIDRPVVVVWRTGRGLGVVLLRAPHGARSLASAYARLANAHLARSLTETAWERTLDGIRPDGTMPRSVALDLFALAYGPLPRTRRPAGRRPPRDEGTLAAVQVLRLWSTLTPAQRASAARSLGITGVKLSRRAAAGPLGPATPPNYGDPSFAPAADLTKLAERFAASEGKKMSRTLRLKIVAGTSSGSGSDEVYADTLPVDEPGTATAGGPFCRIRVFADGQALRKKDSSYFAKVMAHEVFHCFEFDIMGVNGVDRARPWLFEGASDWAGFSEVPQPYEKYDKYSPHGLPKYLRTCGTDTLFSRSYDAEGFFGHVQDVYGNLWAHMPGILTAGGNEAVYKEAGGTEATFLESWASSALVVPQIGLNWVINSPVKAPEGAGCVSSPLTLSPGGTQMDAPSYLLSLYDVDPATASEEYPLLHLQVPKSARFADGTFDTTGLKDAWFCLRQECKCPEGQEGQPPPAPSLKKVAYLGISGGPDGVSGKATVVSLKSYCKEKPKPPNPPPGGPPVGGGGGGGPGCTGGCGSTNGDPHLHTFDNRFYDFQAAGEFTLVHSKVDGLEIQARQQPYPSSQTLAVDTAVAMRVGSDRVGVYGNDLAVRVDGQGLVPGRKLRRLPGGGGIRLVQGQVEVRWPDGSLVRVWSVGSWGLALLLRPVASRQGTLTGLLGNFDGNDKNDLVSRQGQVVNAEAASGTNRTAYRLLYRVLGDSWRITQRQSLFDYAPGQSTRTFTNLRFPARVTLASGLSPRARRAAERICRRLGVREPHTLAACILDVGGTGDGRFATAARELERTAGKFGKPRRGRPPPVSADRRWVPIGSAGRSGITIPSLALDGGKVVAAYVTADSSAEAATFTPVPGKGVANLSRAPIVTGWYLLHDPVLLGRPSGGLQAIISGFHSTTTSDPLNGTSFAPRNPGGSFGPPVPATTSGTIGGPAVLAPDGQPLWPSTVGGLSVWRGATGATSVELAQSLAPATDVYVPSLGRDAGGRYWLAWYGSSRSRPTGLFVVQIDPGTLQPIGAVARAPESESVDNNSLRLAFACAQACRLVYVPDAAAGSEHRLVSWAPGERAPALVAKVRSGDISGYIAAAYTPRGRLWSVWYDRGANGLFATLGNASGGGGRVRSLGRPLSNQGRGPLAAIADGENLVAVVSWGDKGVTRYADVLAPG